MEGSRPPERAGGGQNGRSLLNEFKFKERVLKVFVHWLQPDRTNF